MDFSIDFLREEHCMTKPHPLPTCAMIGADLIGMVAKDLMEIAPYIGNSQLSAVARDTHSQLAVLVIDILAAMRSGENDSVYSSLEFRRTRILRIWGELRRLAVESARTTKPLEVER